MMNKKVFLGFVIFLILMTFVSCGGEKSSRNKFGFYEDLDEAKVVAKKEGKGIMLVIVMEGYDSESADFRENVLVKKELKSLMNGKFVGAYFDFGEAAYAATEVKPNASKSKIAAAERRADMMERNLQFARLLNVRYTPVIFILTADGYYVSDLQYSDNFKSVRKFANELEGQYEKIEEIESIIAATKKGTVIEKMNALNTVCDFTNSSYRATFAELFRQAPEIDEKNESGLVSRLYMEAVLADCIGFYSIGDYGSAIQILLDAIKSGNIDSTEKQGAYYLAGYLLGTSGSTDYETILDYMNRAIQANPESDDIPKIQTVIDGIKVIMEAEKKETEKQTESKGVQ